MRFWGKLGPIYDVRWFFADANAPLLTGPSPLRSVATWGHDLDGFQDNMSEDARRYLRDHYIPPPIGEQLGPWDTPYDKGINRLGFRGDHYCGDLAAFRDGGVRGRDKELHVLPGGGTDCCRPCVDNPNVVMAYERLGDGYVYLLGSPSLFGQYDEGGNTPAVFARNADYWHIWDAWERLQNPEQGPAVSSGPAGDWLMASRNRPTRGDYDDLLLSWRNRSAGDPLLFPLDGVSVLWGGVSRPFPAPKSDFLALAGADDIKAWVRSGGTLVLVAEFPSDFTPNTQPINALLDAMGVEMHLSGAAVGRVAENWTLGRVTGARFIISPTPHTWYGPDDTVGLTNYGWSSFADAGGGTTELNLLDPGRDAPGRMEAIEVIFDLTIGGPGVMPSVNVRCISGFTTAFFSCIFPGPWAAGTYHVVVDGPWVDGTLPAYALFAQVSLIFPAATDDTAITVQNLVVRQRWCYAQDFTGCGNNWLQLSDCAVCNQDSPGVRPVCGVLFNRAAVIANGTPVLYYDASKQGFCEAGWLGLFSRTRQGGGHGQVSRGYLGLLTRSRQHGGYSQRSTGYLAMFGVSTQTLALFQRSTGYVGLTAASVQQFGSVQRSTGYLGLLADSVQRGSGGQQSTGYVGLTAASVQHLGYIQRSTGYVGLTAASVQQLGSVQRSTGYLGLLADSVQRRIEHPILDSTGGPSIGGTGWPTSPILDSTGGPSIGGTGF